ncbi:MAG: uncharacterized protein KVP18_002042 [Porospora cf. gigantea A]|uniref:uncharacterized protein n=1 Tax=Porospora cf. gigantea A TaxID=2853593 RepID=UPI0035596AB6|nr:MAG: hypothetical protein KVP18_002042 [Porospora cf. gigantea A]
MDIDDEAVQTDHVYNKILANQNISQLWDSGSGVALRLCKWEDIARIPDLTDLTGLVIGSEQYTTAAAENTAKMERYAVVEEEVKSRNYMDPWNWFSEEYNPSTVTLIGNYVDGLLGEQPLIASAALMEAGTTCVVSNGERTVTNVLQICALKEALVFHVPRDVPGFTTLKCIGNQEICASINTRAAGETLDYIQAIHCPSPKSSLMVVNNNGSWLLLGNPAFKKFNSAALASSDILPSTIQDQVQGSPTSVVKVAGNEQAIAILTSSSFLFAFGDTRTGGVADGGNVSAVADVVANTRGFALQMSNRKIRSWGEYNLRGGNTYIAFTTDDVPAEIRDGNDGTGLVVSVFARFNCFAAVTDVGKLHTWGAGDGLVCREEGGNGDGFTSYQTVKADLEADVQHVAFTEGAMFAVKTNGDSVLWGKHDVGGTTTSDRLRQLYDINVSRVFSTRGAFLACRNDGACFAWGSGTLGGDDSVASRFTQGNVKAIGASDDLFMAMNPNLITVWNTSMGILYEPAGGTLVPIPLPHQSLVTGQRFIVAVLGKPCTVNDWSAFTQCTASCGGGTETRTRSLTFDGINYDCTLALDETQACNEDACTTPSSFDPNAAARRIGFISVAVAAGVGGLILVIVLSCVAWKHFQ